MRLPGRTRTPSSLGPDGEKLKRPRAAAFARCVYVAFSLGGCRLTPPPVPRRRESETEKRLLLKRSNQRRRRKPTGRRSLPHPRLSGKLGAARPLPAAAEGAGPRGRGGVSPGNPRPEVGALVDSACILKRSEEGGRGEKTLQE